LSPVAIEEDILAKAKSQFHIQRRLRATAQECQRMAGISRNPDEKAVWQRWRSTGRLVPKAGPTEAEQGKGN
jgi:hypothetical protein